MPRQRKDEQQCRCCAGERKEDCVDHRTNATDYMTVGATATTSRRRGRPVINGGSRGAVGVATQVARSSCVDVAEADTEA